VLISFTESFDKHLLEQFSFSSSRVYRGREDEVVFDYKLITVFFTLRDLVS
jgi:hypothetical protein